jgi:hypothetical protein
MHNRPMGERNTTPRRMLIGDARRNGNHLRATWRPASRQFVLSTWHGDVCTGAIRLPVEDGAELAGLLVRGLAEAAAAPPVATPPAERHGLPGLAQRLATWLRGATGRTPSEAAAGRPQARPTRPTGAARPAEGRTA